MTLQNPEAVSHIKLKIASSINRSKPEMKQLSSCHCPQPVLYLQQARVNQPYKFSTPISSTIIMPQCKLQPWYHSITPRNSEQYKFHHCEVAAVVKATPTPPPPALVVVMIIWDSKPRFCSSWESHFLVVLSSLRVTAKVVSLSCSGRQVLSASLALHGKLTNFRSHPTTLNKAHLKLSDNRR